MLQPWTSGPGDGVSLLIKRLPLEERGSGRGPSRGGSRRVVVGGQWAVREMEGTLVEVVTRHRGAPEQSTCDLIQDEGGSDQRWGH